jgi:rSAM/selenodomain-associated transferase 2
MDWLSGARWWSWQRLVCLLFTAAILAFVFQRLDRGTLWSSLSSAHLGWTGLSFLAYGVALILGGCRWHVVLHAIHCTVHAVASVRLAFIGHFFFFILLGAAAGDVAKAALYARWYRYGLPEIMASLPIDRVLGAIAAILVGTAALLVGFTFGAFERSSIAEIQLKSIWWLAFLAIILALVLGLIFWRPRGNTWWWRAWRTLRSGTATLLSSRRHLMRGLLLAIAAQTALAAVFALNLRAVAGAPLPWLQLAWTFPAVMMLSCMPVTVAGAGVREMLAITFLGIYGVPASECVSAALLTFLCKVTWCLIGGGVLWRETAVQQRVAKISEATTVSVVIPVLNEAEALPVTIQHLRRNESIHEIIVVDGGSSDGTAQLGEQLGCRVLASTSGRGGQMRAGASAASGDVVLLLHADTWLPLNGIHSLLNCLRDRSVVAGGFWKEFRESPLLLLGSKWKCAVRLWFGRRTAGDQGMFVRRNVLERIGGVPAMALMEEFALCSQLRRVGRLALADAVVLTSARRFLKHGIIRTYLLMWRLTMQHWLGATPERLRKLYEGE